MDQAIHWLVSIALIEMMIAIGLGVSWHELMYVARNWHLILTTVFTNYVIVPAATFGLILMLNSPPSISTGFFVLAVCPGASYGPPITSLGKGNVRASVGLMVLLAGSSAILAPLMLHVLLPLLSVEEPVTIDLKRVLEVLMVTQFAPLFIGLTIRQWQPSLAEKLRGPAASVGLILNCIVVGLLFATKYSLFDQLEFRWLLGMSFLLIISLAAGWQFGGPMREDRKALALATSLRNVGLSLVIAMGAFPGTPAVTAILGYGFFEIIGSVLMATWWHWRGVVPMQREADIEHNRVRSFGK